MGLFFTFSFTTFVFVIVAAGAAPAALAQSCPPGCSESFAGGCVLSADLIKGVITACPTQSGVSNLPQKQTGVSNTNNSASKTTLINPLGPKTTTLSKFLESILDIIIRVGSVIVILMLVFVGFKFVTARGEPGEISEAKQMLLWTVVGALILLGAKVIAAGIEATVKALSTGG